MYAIRTSILTFFCCNILQISCFFSNSTNRLSFSLYNALENKGDNILYSPISISIGLGMLMEGATSATKKEIINFLTFGQKSNDEEIISNFFKQVLNFYDNFESKVRFGNIVILDQHINAKPFYKNVLKNNYFALVVSENISIKGPKVIETVNIFIQNKTHHFIEKVLNYLNLDAKFVLINTISFDGKWVKPFNKFMNLKRPFYGSKKSYSEVTFMKKISQLGFADISEKDARLIQLDYVENLSMFILLPNQRNGLKHLLKNLTVSELESFINRISLTTIEVQIPKLNFESSLDLISLLPKLGLESTFSLHANFKNISDAQNLCISQAIQKSKLSIDEEGTKASVFTAFTFNTLSEIMNIPTFIADHPFLFIIRENVYKINLFVGIVNKLGV